RALSARQPSARSENRLACACHHLARRYHLELRGPAPLPLDFSFGESLLPDRDSQRQADQIGVLELHAGTLVAIVEQHLDARLGELTVELLSRLAHRRVLHLQRQKRYVQWRDAGRPADA